MLPIAALADADLLLDQRGRDQETTTSHSEQSLFAANLLPEDYEL